MRELLSEELRKRAAAVLVAMVVVGAVGSTSGAASANNASNNPYPYAKPTYWAWQNRPDLSANLGEAREWDNNAEAQGWPVGQYPRRGDIAVFEPGIYGAPESGHVAVVEQVFDDGTYLSSQMDEKDCKYDSSNCGRVNRREYPIVAGTRFIHYMKDTRTTWGFASGAAGWTARDLGQGNMGGPGWYYPIAGADPHLVSPELDIRLDDYNAVEIDMVMGAPVADPSIQVYFATQEQPTFAEARSVKLMGEADGQLHRYTARFSGNPYWKGKLVRLRLDPVGGGTTGGVRVDRVRLVHVESEAPAYAMMSGGTTPMSCRDRRRP